MNGYRAPQKWNQYFIVGKIKDAFGLKGEVTVLSFSGSFDWLSDLTELTITQTKIQKDSDKAEIQKYKILKSRIQKNLVHLVLDGVVNRNQSEDLVSSLVLVEEAHFQTQEKEGEFYLNQIKGYTFKSTSDNKIGVIVGFGSNGAQDLLVIEMKGEEYLVPYILEWVEKLSHEEKVLQMSLPEGLLGE